MPRLAHTLRLVCLGALLYAVQGGSAGSHESFAAIAERLFPAVVNISTSQVVEPESETAPPQQGTPQSPFEDFFEDFFRPRENRPRRLSSLGSGFVIDPTGVIITNNHVVEKADAIKVTFHNGEKHDATIIGRDPKTDLAVLKITTEEPVPFVVFGDSTKSRVGDWVIAIGNPFGLGGSLSVGVISAINRNINAGPYDSFIQTDAAINRGNSGGPLFNTKGEVIGVNSAIISPTGGSVGIGFSIPADSTLMTVISQLREYGETRRGWLGVRVQEVTDELAETLALGKARGALVAEVSTGGPAEKAGLQQGDVIISFNETMISEMHDLPRLVAETPINKLVEVVVMRQAQQRKFWVKIGRLDESGVAQAATEQRPTPADRAAEALGMKLRTLDDELRVRWRVSDAVNGVIVVDVDESKTAFVNGMRAGDVIQEIDQTPITLPSEFIKNIADAKAKGKKSVLLLVSSSSGVRFVALQIR